MDHSTALTDPRYSLATRHRVLAGLLLLLHAAIVWVLRAPAVATANDDAVYLLLARSLRHFAYLDAHVVGSPVHSLYPPAYPAVLALVGGPLGPNIDGPLAVTLLLSLITLLLLFDLARRVMPPAWALVMLALLAVNPRLIDFAGQVRTEVPYAAFTVAAVWFLTIRGGLRSGLIAGAAFAIVAALTRSIGITILAAVGMVWLQEREWKRLGWFIGASAVTVGSWILWNVLAPDQFASRSYAVSVTKAPTGDIEQPWMLLFHRMERFFDTYSRSLPANLGAPSLDISWLDNAAWLLLIAILLGAGLWASWKKAPSVTAYTASYFLFLAFWPTKLSRFIIPIVPFVLLLLAWGAWVLAERWKPKLVVAVAGLGAVLLCWGSLSGAYQKYESASRCVPRTAVDRGGNCFSDDQRSFFALMDYVKRELPDTAAFVTTKEATFGYYTGRKVLHPDLAIQKYEIGLLPKLVAHGIEYIVVSPLHPTPLPKILVPRCRDLEVVRSFPPRTALLHIRSVVSAPEDPRACAAVTQLALDTTWLHQ